MLLCPLKNSLKSPYVLTMAVGSDTGPRGDGQARPPPGSAHAVPRPTGGHADGADGRRRRVVSAALEVSVPRGGQRAALSRLAPVGK